mgnify:FL=1|jgi:hypothetical protein
MSDEYPHLALEPAGLDLADRPGRQDFPSVTFRVSL